MPTRNIFGWQKPCYLLGEGYVKTFKELMETTDWDAYGTGRYEKCANCMAHCGYEPTAAEAVLRNPIRTLAVAMRGPRTEGAFAAEIPLEDQRPAQYVFSENVQQKLSEIRKAEVQEEGCQEADGPAGAARTAGVALKIKDRPQSDRPPSCRSYAACRAASCSCRHEMKSSSAWRFFICAIISGSFKVFAKASRSAATRSAGTPGGASHTWAKRAVEATTSISKRSAGSAMKSVRSGTSGNSGSRSSPITSEVGEQILLRPKLRHRPPE